jgi:hypothetical protein
MLSAIRSAVAFAGPRRVRLNFGNLYVVSNAFYWQAFSTTSSRSADLAKLILVGHLGKDPEIRMTKNDKEYVLYVLPSRVGTPAHVVAHLVVVILSLPLTSLLRLLTLMAVRIFLHKHFSVLTLIKVATTLQLLGTTFSRSTKAPTTTSATSRKEPMSTSRPTSNYASRNRLRNLVPLKASVKYSFVTVSIVYSAPVVSL